MIGAGAELTAVGQVLREAARVAAPAVSRTRAGQDRRTDAYIELQRAAVDVLGRLDTLVALHEAVPANQRMVVAAATVMGTRAIGNDATGFSRTVAAATQSLSLLLLGREMVDRFCADRAALTEMVTFNASVARLLGGLTEVRLVGGRDVQEAAENLVMVLGEAISEIPVVKDHWLTRSRPPEMRYAEVRTAAMYRLRMFGAVARRDLSPLRFRRKTRRRWWQIYRPRPPAIHTIDIDLEKLISDSTGSS